MANTQYYCAASLDGEPGPMGEDGTYDAFYDGVGVPVSGSATYEFARRET